ncbi:LacI family DNA-binding transcriptional regulator [Fodinicola acaciae]|uniref:LacI family DNA-binding transcriptional regulator n=1 Tax=Fodinicola acaciae TaxID=2681555 RepID=UPI0013D2B01D|nr:LacI family DNA-binding transcriptional regulator [Fodinicola acaciae]
MAVTIQEVARAANVSPSTVSNVLNGRDGRMLPETKLRVEAAIARLGYRPNRAARQLRTGRIQMLGLVVPSVANPFWGTFAQLVESVALRSGFRVLLCNSERDPEREHEYLEELWADGVGSVVLCSSLPSIAHVEPFLRQGMRIVAFDRISQLGDPAGLTNISVDNSLGAQLATSHLLELGHRRLAFVSGKLQSVNRQERLTGFRSTVDRLGVPAVVWTDDGSGRGGDLDAAEVGRAAAYELLDSAEPPTAFFAVNDMCALGVCAGVRDAGLVVGTDVSVVGFDDIALADLAFPALTTIRQPLPEMAAAAVTYLVGSADSGAGQSVMMRPELVVRASTAANGSGH